MPALFFHFEFNKNSTPLRKVQQSYKTLQNAKSKKPSVFNAFSHITKR